MKSIILEHPLRIIAKEILNIVFFHNEISFFWRIIANICII